MARHRVGKKRGRKSSHSVRLEPTLKHGGHKRVRKAMRRKKA